MEAFIDTLVSELEKQGNPAIALGQQAYLRDQFAFYGLKATTRREIQKIFLTKACLPEKEALEEIVRVLWHKPQREYQYFAQELVFKFARQFEEKDIALLEFMVKHKSWWDTVDFIASKLMGAYFKKYPEKREFYVQKWLDSGNIWLQRSALLFQLKYKKDLNTTLLSSTIEALLGTKEFFINKAIGWVLREYSRTDPQWVIVFAGKTALSNLSRTEALRLIRADVPNYQGGAC